MLRLLPGDVVVAVSDGLLQAQDATGQPFGFERLSELLSEQRRQPLDRMVETICRAALDFTGHPRPPDDVLVFALRYSRDE
jgi:serine phosphatase RsbU (regulator of sigma subunit)